PTFFRLFTRKVLHRRDPDYVPSTEAMPVEWLAGMFLLFPSDVYRTLDGFDERYFMYFEDVDISRRLWRRRYKAYWVGTTSVMHHAARASRRNTRYLAWHIHSLARYFFAPARH